MNPSVDRDEIVRRLCRGEQTPEMRMVVDSLIRRDRSIGFATQKVHEGVDFTTVSVPDQPPQLIAVFLNGASFETESRQYGLAHFIEHLLMHATADGLKHPWAHKNRKSLCNGRTNKNHMLAFTQGSPVFFAESRDALFNALTTGFTPDIIEHERTRILSEIVREQQLSSPMLDKAFSDFFGAHRVGAGSTIGSSVDVQNFTVAEINEFYGQMREYCPVHVILSGDSNLVNYFQGECLDRTRKTFAARQAIRIAQPDQHHVAERIARRGMVIIPTDRIKTEFELRLFFPMPDYRASTTKEVAYGLIADDLNVRISDTPPDARRYESPRFEIRGDAYSAILGAFYAQAERQNLLPIVRHMRSVISSLDPITVDPMDRILPMTSYPVSNVSLALDGIPEITNGKHTTIFERLQSLTELQGTNLRPMAQGFLNPCNSALYVCVRQDLYDAKDEATMCALVELQKEFEATFKGT